jgi:protein ImuB
VVASLLDGCELVLLRPPERASAQVRHRLEATLRRGRGVLLVAGDWPGAQLRLRVASQRWDRGSATGTGGCGPCCAEITADGRGEAAMTRTRWLWLPGEDGGVAVADPADLPFDIDGGTAGSRARPAGGERVSARAPAASAGNAPRVMVVTCPDLHRRQPERRPDRDTARRHERVIAAVTGFCPDVEVVEPGVCAFGARGPARYFGGETALAARITAALADLGEHGKIGVADGFFAALLAARDGRRRAAGRGGEVPGRPAGERPGRRESSYQSPAAQDLVALLNRLGLRTLGDFAALPVRDVASRFGDAGEGAHRLARGLDSRPLATRPPPADLSVVQEFDPPEPRAEPLVFAAKALAGRLHDGLAARGLTCVRVQVIATWADGRESSRRWRHDGLLSAAAVADRVRWQLDGGPPAPPDDDAAQAPPDDGEQYQPGGIVALRLVPDPGRPRHRAAARLVGGDAGQ